eukprot:2203481-Pyramimonas_sp.AAC.2
MLPDECCQLSVQGVTSAGHVSREDAKMVCAVGALEALGSGACDVRTKKSEGYRRVYTPAPGSVRVACAVAHRLPAASQ